jgi:peptide/nickel transport system substrate-binding protein
VASGVEGVPNGTSLEFSYLTTTVPQRQPVTEILQASLAECGMKVNLEYLDPIEYFADGPDGPLFGRRFDIGQFAWLTGVEPPCDTYTTQQIPGPLEEGMCGWGCLNNPGFSNEEYDAVCSAANQALPGQPEYEANHLEAQRLFAEQLPVVPLYLRLKLAVSRPDMRNFVVDPTENDMWNIEEFDYGE